MAFPEEFLIDVRKPADPWNSHVHPATWERMVLDSLRTIAGSEAGQALLGVIKKARFWIAIEPTIWGECNAHGAARISVEGLRQFGGAVKFDPESYLAGSSCYIQKRRDQEKYGFQPDQILFHELIHALRGGARKRLNDPNGKGLGGGLKRYGTEEEFIAVLLTNIYTADLTNRTNNLRRDWVGGKRLEHALSTSVGFFQSSTKALALLERFQTDHPELFQAMANVEAPFNPLEAMIKHPQEVRKASQSALAKQRDVSIPKQPLGLIKPVPPPPMDPMGFVKAFGEAMAGQALRVLNRH
jgi:hypothetical protein